MKKTLLTVCAVTFCFTTFSQEDRLSNENNSRNKSTTISTVEAEDSPKISKTEIKSKTQTISKRAGEPQQRHDESYYLKEITKIDNHLETIRQKTDAINSNPEEKALAEENGWFEQMEETKSQLNAQKSLLEQKLNK